jgi:RNA polymerase sigma factor (sigma-70 family)
MFGRGRSGDDFARDALAHADCLHNLARYLAGDGAEDLVQETYARAMAAAYRFERGTNLKAFLFRILRNAFIDQARRKGHEPEPPEPERDLLRDDAELELLRGVVGRDIGEALLRQSLRSYRRT